MSDTLTVDTGQADQLAASLVEAADRLADPDTLLADIAAQLAADASARAPRRTGALAGSGSITPGQVEGHPARLLTWGVRYALFVNFGTRYMRAQPFATDALDAAAGAAEPQLRAWAETIVDQVGV